MATYCQLGSFRLELVVIIKPFAAVEFPAASKSRCHVKGVSVQWASFAAGPPEPEFLYWNLKTRFQSFFMSTTVQPFPAAASKAASSRPNADLRS